MGRFWNAIDALMAPKNPKPKPVLDPTPQGVRVLLPDGRVITPIVMKLPENGHGDLHMYVAYGPQSVGTFPSCVLEVDTLPGKTKLTLALEKAPGTDGHYRFATLTT